MKALGIKILKTALNASLFVSAVFLVACDDGGSLVANEHSYLPPSQSYEACNYQHYPVGIPGNAHCPYQGNYINGQVEAFAQVNIQGRAEIDFGLQYNDACPPGQMPVFEYVYGNLVHTRCDHIGGSYVDNVFFQHHNISNCAGGYAGDQRCIPM